jgi:predicted nucleic acid-binding protein
LIFADQKAMLKTRGKPISDLDLMIAAITMKHRGVLVTNDRDFERLPELRCENWLKARH